MADPAEAAATAPAWGPGHTSSSSHDDFVPILLGGAHALLIGFLERRQRESFLFVVAVLLAVGAWLLWPILLSLRIDETTSMEWAAVWTPLWIADGIGLVFFVLLVSRGGIKAPAGWQGEWRDPYPLPMRALALVKWCLLLLFQVFLVQRLDRHINWPWEEVLAPLMAWVCLRVLGELTRIFLQKERLLMGRVVAAARTTAEATALVLQVLFLMWRLDGKVDWNWWEVFVPLWLLFLGQLISWCANQALTFFLARGLENAESATEEQRKRMLEASVLVDNAKHFRPIFGGSLVSSVLAVALASGADFSAFFIFIPQFFSAAWFAFGATCLVCCGSRRARSERLGGEGEAKQEGGSTQQGSQRYELLPVSLPTCTS